MSDRDGRTRAERARAVYQARIREVQEQIEESTGPILNLLTTTMERYRAEMNSP